MRIVRIAPMRVATAAALLLLSSGALFGQAGRAGGAASAGFGISGDAATLALLQRARATIGPDARLRAVDGFVIEPANPKSRGYKVRFPDKLRVDYDIVITVLDGPKFWQQRPAGVTGLPELPSAPADGRQAAFARSVVALCLELLLRAPDAYPVVAKHLGRKNVHGLDGDVIEFRLRDNTIVHQMILDPITHRALGTAVVLTGQAGQYTLMERLEAHQEVSGLKLPMRIREQRVYPTPEESLSGAYEIGRIILTAPGLEEFRAPAEKSDHQR